MCRSQQRMVLKDRPPRMGPAPAPAAVNLRQAPVGSGRSAAHVAPAIAFRGGTLKFYKGSKTFEAQCGCMQHGDRCTWSKKKTLAAASSSSRPRSPIAQLATWLSFGSTDFCDSKAAHKSSELLQFLQSPEQDDLCLTLLEEHRAQPGGEEIVALNFH